jgi:serine/threonine protein kinase
MPESLAIAPERAERNSLSSEALARGTRLGRYELLVPIAVGGMARVWAARLHGQRGFTKLVAIKTILPHLACDPEFERMLVDEARIASGARHPNVVEIYELGEEGGVVYIAMEWVHGDSLSQILKAGGAARPLDTRIAGRIVADAAAGLHAAHNLTDERGTPLQVVHRDVSPHNLLVSLDGNVKVTDFGVAKAIGAVHEATSAGQLKGKIAYMAPEQAATGSVDRRSDVFSLGCVLYEATTGQKPFRGEGEHQVLQELIKGSFAPPSRVIRGYPFELERIVLRAMSSTPLHRYQTMEQMRLALEEWLAKGGVVVTQSNVAQAVRERLGAEAEKRREQIRLATLAVPEPGEIDAAPIAAAGEAVRSPSTTPSGVKTSAGTPFAKRESSPPQGPRGPSSSDRAPGEGEGMTASPLPPPAADHTSRTPSAIAYAVAASLGVIAAAALAACVFWVWKSVQPAPRAVVVVAPAFATQVSEAKGESAAPSIPPPPTVPPIAFKVLPEKAWLIVDGSALPPSVRSMPRPSAGTVTAVTVHADGYEDQNLSIDESAPASVDVWLTPSVSPANAPARRSGGGRPSEGAAKATDSAKAPEPLPANPY